MTRLVSQRNLAGTKTVVMTVFCWRALLGISGGMIAVSVTVWYVGIFTGVHDARVPAEEVWWSTDPCVPGCACPAVVHLHQGVGRWTPSIGASTDV